MLTQQKITSQSEWQTGVRVWDNFTEQRPELGLRKGKWAFHNFLRPYRSALVRADVIRMARNRFWLAHVDRFDEVAFDCATGHSNSEIGGDESGVPGQISIQEISQGDVQSPALIVRDGLTPTEHFQRHGILQAGMAEAVLIQNEKCLTAVKTAIAALPACTWNFQAMTPIDRQRVLEMRVALLALTHD